MIISGRNESADDYRYGFQGSEKDDEVSGINNSYDFGARLYSPRIGRWWTIDPQAYNQPAWSPYKSMYNNPLKYSDPDGETEYLEITVVDERTGDTYIITAPVSDDLIESHVYENGMVHYFDYTKKKTVTIQKDGSVVAGETTGPWTGEERAQVPAFIPFRKSVAKIMAYGNDDLEGDGGSQPGGEHLVTEDGGASSTKQKAENDVETRDITDLMMALGAVKGGKLPNTAAESVRKYISNVKKINKVLGNPMQIPKSGENVGGTPPTNTYGGTPMTIEYIKTEKDSDSGAPGTSSTTGSNGTTTTSTGDLLNQQPGDTLITTENNGQDTIKVDVNTDKKNSGGGWIKERIQTGSSK